jgi:hypothetical protein
MVEPMFMQSTESFNQIAKKLLEFPKIPHLPRFPLLLDNHGKVTGNGFQEGDM